jgi:hypothetical protein
MAEICFLGEFSFSNNFSLSSCPIIRRDTFVRYQNTKVSRRMKIAPKEEGEVTDKWGRNLQIIVAMSLHGIVYY